MQSRYVQIALLLYRKRLFQRTWYMALLLAVKKVYKFFR